MDICCVFAKQRLLKMLWTAFLVLGFSILETGGETLAASPVDCPKSAMFVFGDSLTDTGNIEYLGLDYLRPPYGQSYSIPGTINPSRFSDGRLVIDFFAQAFGFPFLKPITARSLISQDEGYEYGVNFAYGGATAVPNILASPFSLFLEVQQFLAFKKTSRIPYADPLYFEKALYVISPIGGNDFLNAYSVGLTPSQVIKITVPLAVNAIRNALETLYTSGSRNFFVFNVPPVGCIPSVLTLYEGNGVPVDEIGCLSEYNEVVEVFNARLNATAEEYRSRWSDASILFLDVFGASKVIYSNPETYGFRKDKALVACCGYGGQYNYNPSVRCGTSGHVKDRVTDLTTFVNISSACEDPAQHLTWDGVHPTEGLNRQLALFFLNGSYVDGLSNSSNLNLVCNLNFTGF